LETNHDTGKNSGFVQTNVIPDIQVLKFSSNRSHKRSNQKKMKVAVAIPARYSSSRFEGKPLALINGKPMIQRVYENVSKSECVKKVVVATDDKRIFDCVKNFGGDVLMTSDKNRSGTDRVAETARVLSLNPKDIIVNVQGDQPLIHPDCIDEVVKPFETEPDLNMSTLAFKIINKDEITNPKDVKVTFDNNGFALYFSRSPIPFCRDENNGHDTFKHLGIYAYTQEFVEIFRELPAGKLENLEKLEQLRALENGYAIKIAVTKHDSPEVDLPEDIAKVENALTR